MFRYIGDLEDVLKASGEYLEDGGLLGFTCELISPEDCALTEASIFHRHFNLLFRTVTPFLGGGDKLLVISVVLCLQYFHKIPNKTETETVENFVTVRQNRTTFICSNQADMPICNMRRARTN